MTFHLRLRCAATIHAVLMMMLSLGRGDRLVQLQVDLAPLALTLLLEQASILATLLISDCSHDLLLQAQVLGQLREAD